MNFEVNDTKEKGFRKKIENRMYTDWGGIQIKHNLHYNERACIMEHMNNHTDTHLWLGEGTHTCVHSYA